MASKNTPKTAGKRPGGQAKANAKSAEPSASESPDEAGAEAEVDTTPDDAATTGPASESDAKPATTTDASDNADTGKTAAKDTASKGGAAKTGAAKTGAKGTTGKTAAKDSAGKDNAKSAASEGGSKSAKTGQKTTTGKKTTAGKSGGKGAAAAKPGQPNAASGPGRKNAGGKTGSKGAGNKSSTPGAGGKGGSTRQRAKAAKAVAAARAARGRRNRLIATVVACVVILCVLIGGVSYAVYKTEQSKNQIEAADITAHYPVKVDNGTVLAGKSNAKVKIDIYEDFMCPYCGDLERKSGSAMQKDLNNGSLQIRYRIVDTLNANSNPAGYSQRAANAAIATVPAGKFAQYHWSLFHDQAEESGPGYSDKQLLDLGKRLGIDGKAYNNFAKAVKKGTYSKYPSVQADKLKNDKSLHQPNGQYGTPTVVHNGQLIDTGKSNWLSSLGG